MLALRILLIVKILYASKNSEILDSSDDSVIELDSSRHFSTYISKDAKNSQCMCKRQSDKQAYTKRLIDKDFSGPYAYSNRRIYFMDKEVDPSSLQDSDKGKAYFRDTPKETSKNNPSTSESSKYLENALDTFEAYIRRGLSEQDYYNFLRNYNELEEGASNTESTDNLDLNSRSKRNLIRVKPKDKIESLRRKARKNRAENSGEYRIKESLIKIIQTNNGKRRVRRDVLMDEAEEENQTNKEEGNAFYQGKQDRKKELVISSSTEADLEADIDMDEFQEIAETSPKIARRSDIEVDLKKIALEEEHESEFNPAIQLEPEKISRKKRKPETMVNLEELEEKFDPGFESLSDSIFEPDSESNSESTQNKPEEEIKMRMILNTEEIDVEHEAKKEAAKIDVKLKAKAEVLEKKPEYESKEQSEPQLQHEKQPEYTERIKIVPRLNTEEDLKEEASEYEEEPVTEQKTKHEHKENAEIEKPKKEERVYQKVRFERKDSGIYFYLDVGDRLQISNIEEINLAMSDTSSEPSLSSSSRSSLDDIERDLVAMSDCIDFCCLPSCSRTVFICFPDSKNVFKAVLQGSIKTAKLGLKLINHYECNKKKKNKESWNE